MQKKNQIQSDLRIGQIVKLDWDGPTEAMVVGLTLEHGQVTVTVARGDDVLHVREGELYTETGNSKE